MSPLSFVILPPTTGRVSSAYGTDSRAPEGLVPAANGPRAPSPRAFGPAASGCALVASPAPGAALQAPQSPRLFGKTVLFGGSFDPPHWGTAWCVRRLLAAGAAQVWLMPVATHADKPHLSAFADRMEMSERLCEHLRHRHGIADDRLLVTNLEAFVPSGGQTLDVLRAARSWFPRCRLLLAVGGDVGASMSSWPRADELRREFPVVVLERGGGPWPADLAAGQEAAVELSSTAVRRRRLAGDSVADCAPPSVVEWIDARGLYQSAPTP